ncbi:MAG: hypothetical protein EAZ55_02020 [Cytophagales bacterium]|nr:MAG: hypothetical protein EAZ55_02020 [Cytophagales bacterium]
METLETGKIVLDDRHAKIIWLAELNTVFCQAKSEYIPTLKFKEIFAQIGEIVKNNVVTKVIFDKRSLKVFDQTAMTWYHVSWKKEMALYGLKQYIKILPQDNAFRMSVEIGKNRILMDNPTFRFEDYQIFYTETVEEALNK